MPVAAGPTDSSSKGKPRPHINQPTPYDIVGLQYALRSGHKHHGAAPGKSAFAGAAARLPCWGVLAQLAQACFALSSELRAPAKPARPAAPPPAGIRVSLTRSRRSYGCDSVQLESNGLGWRPVVPGACGFPLQAHPHRKRSSQHAPALQRFKNTGAWYSSGRSQGERFPTRHAH